VNDSHWQDFDREFCLKAAAMRIWKWTTHDTDLWDYHVTAVAAAGKGPIQSGPSVPPYGQSGRLMGYQRPPTRPTLKTTNRGRGQEGDNLTPWRKRACYSWNFDRSCAKEAKGEVCSFLHTCYSCGHEDHAAWNAQCIPQKELESS